MPERKKFAVVLSGCGVFDGSEIHEATLTLYAIARNGAQYHCFAPDIMQFHVINHISGEVMNEKRSVLVESARIARGTIDPLHRFHEKDFDALVFPGGLGSSKNLSGWVFDGIEAKVNPDVERSVKSMMQACKPIGALCISPVLLALIAGEAKLTVGNDPGTIENLSKLGVHHQVAGHGEVVYDKNLNFFSTPCYMLNASIDQIGAGAEELIKAMLSKMK